jgi:hypothetical protein
MEAQVSDSKAILAEFFPELPFAHLWVEAKGGLVRWRLIFQDLGMCHELERSFRYRSKDGVVWIGRTRARDAQHLREMIFDHYPRWRRRLDRHLRLSPKKPKTIGPKKGSH